MKNDEGKKPEADASPIGQARLTRRGFLKTTAGTAALAAVAGTALNLSKGVAEAAQERKLPAKWDEQVDVIVVGSGFAGLASAAEACAAKASVLVLEKMPTYGGNSIISGGTFCAWDDKTHMRQRLNLGEDSVEQHKKDTLKGGDFYGIPELVDIFVNGATPGIDWLIEEGNVVFRESINRGGGHTAYRARKVTEGIGRGISDPMKKIAESRGAKIRLGTEVTWLWRKDANSPVLGVEVARGKRKSNIRAKRAVVLASGGFGADKKMRMSFNPSIVPEYNTTNQPGATGEMIRFAQAIGADTLQLAFIQQYPFAEPESGTLDTWASFCFGAPGYGGVYVNKQGQRFVSELERRDVCSQAQIKLGTRPTYTIIREAMIPKMRGAEGKQEVEDGLKKGRLLKADTIRELAAKINVPADALAETVEKHNKYLQEGKDPDFNKPITKSMMPLNEGPFYAIAQWPAVHHCMGGLRIDTECRVIDIWGSPIPRLYAAGEIVGGIHGSNRLGGNAIADCVVFGRLAGRKAGAEKA